LDFRFKVRVCERPEVFGEEKGSHLTAVRDEWRRLRIFVVFKEEILICYPAYDVADCSEVGELQNRLQIGRQGSNVGVCDY